MKIILLTACLTTLCLAKADFATAQYRVDASQPANSIPNTVADFYSHLGPKMWKLSTVKASDVESVKPNTIGTTFLTDDWATGTIYITSNRKLENQQFKYDIEHNLFLLKEEEVAKSGENQPYRIINGAIVLAFDMEDEKGFRHYLSSHNSGFQKNGGLTLGFLEVLTHGNMNLYMKTDASILKANYNVALSVGEKEDRVVKERVYLLRKDGENELHQIKNNKKNNLTFFGSKQSEIDRFMKQYKLKLSDKEDLIKIVSYYNTLDE